MRRVIIWVLIILLIAGFVYTGNNLLSANGFTESKTFPVQYLPETSFLVIASGNENNLSAIFPSLSSLYPDEKESSRVIYLSGKDDSITYITKPLNIKTDIIDSLIYKFRKNSFNTNLEWENGFPIIESASINKKLFASSWRKWAFLSSDKESLEKVLFAILGKAESITKDTDFQMLWKNSNAPIYGIAYTEGKETFTERLKIPFVCIKFPTFFEYYNDNTLRLLNTNSSQEGTLFFKPFHFDNVLLEIAEPELSRIKNLIDESGLQMIISEKLGFPFDKFSAFSSMNSGEFVLLNKNSFLFAVKSTPLSNSLYESELQNLLEHTKTSKETVNNFRVVKYQNANTEFYTLETPSLFVISNSKQQLLEIANKTAKLFDAGKSSLFLFVNTKFNDVINLYSLNVPQVILPNFATYCILTQTCKQDELTTEIKFGK